jgi:CRP/FNR family transcriptional regulator, dissimilatory nitrate respiration regulator
MRILQSDKFQQMDMLRGNEYFDTMPDSILHQIADHMQLREYERGEALFWEGDACDGLYVVLQGSAKIYRLSLQGRQYIVRVLQEGDTFAEVPAFDGGINPVNVEALESCKLWVIESEILRELILSHPQFAKKVLVNFGTMLRQMVRQVSEMAFYQVTHRLARLINELPPDDMGTVSLMTQEQMAARLGTVREVVARSLKELERSGAIQVENRRIRILDQAAFSQWMN